MSIKKTAIAAGRSRIGRPFFLTFIDYNNGMNSLVDLRSHPRFEAILAAFESRYIPEPNSGCWLWIGNSFASRGGYGCFTMRPARIKSERAHRLAWKIHVGQISREEHVLHRCDNPVCVNPAHLFLGDQSTNMKDKCEKGRQDRGSDHWNVKLKPRDVIKIRSSTDRKKLLAKRYGVSPATITDIQKRRSWQHI
jgi:hypothetical protein